MTVVFCRFAKPLHFTVRTSRASKEKGLVIQLVEGWRFQKLGAAERLHSGGACQESEDLAWKPPSAAVALITVTNLQEK
jgi:hypothetical protein